jgi:imidazolonepropionase-like amidohydrolase
MIALTNGNINTITNGVIKRGTILIDKGKIKDIGQNVKIPKNAEEINLRGK